MVCQETDENLIYNTKDFLKLLNTNSFPEPLNRSWIGVLPDKETDRHESDKFRAFSKRIQFIIRLNET